MTIPAFPKPTKADRQRRPMDTRSLPLPKRHFDRDEKYLEWVRTLQCVLMAGDCHGKIQAAHALRGGRGIKGCDASALPLCAMHHFQYDNSQLCADDVIRIFVRLHEIREDWHRRKR